MGLSDTLLTSIAFFEGAGRQLRDCYRGPEGLSGLRD